MAIVSELRIIVETYYYDYQEFVSLLEKVNLKLPSVAVIMFRNA